MKNNLEILNKEKEKYFGKTEIDGIYYYLLIEAVDLKQFHLFNSKNITEEQFLNIANEN